jgi:hypothetical protein
MDYHHRQPHGVLDRSSRFWSHSLVSLAKTSVQKLNGCLTKAGLDRERLSGCECFASVARRKRRSTISSRATSNARISQRGQKAKAGAKCGRGGPSMLTRNSEPIRLASESPHRRGVALLAVPSVTQPAALHLRTQSSKFSRWNSGDGAPGKMAELRIERLRRSVLFDVSDIGCRAMLSGLNADVSANRNEDNHQRNCGCSHPSSPEEQQDTSATRRRQEYKDRAEAPPDPAY